jgi:hypothetical protein
VALDEVGAVFWRWVWAPPGDPAIADPHRREWAAKEDRAAIFGVLKSLPVRHVNHPERAEAASSKPVQLVVAKECGLRTPRTLITGSGATAAAWAAEFAEVLYKAFFSHGTEEGGMIPASRIEMETLPEGSLYAASTFQQVIRGRSIRTTMIGEQAFSAAIDTAVSTLDWRPSQQAASYRQLATPPAVHARLRDFMGRFGLEYGAFDFIEDESGDWWFLEINPAGQYGFVELKAGLPITAAIVDRLCEPVPQVQALARGTVKPCPI